MAKIVFFDAEKEEEDFFKQNFPNDELLFSPLTLESGREYEADLFNAEVISIFAISQAKAEVLEKFPNLKYVTTRSTGFDHVDLEYCNLEI
jgi:D-lactate dehydrogenase